MSGYGFGECPLCGAIDDYCAIKGAQGVDIDCRHLADLLTPEQQAELKAMLMPEWYVEHLRELRQ